VNTSPEPSVTLLISRGQKLIPTIKVCPALVACDSVKVTVPPEVGSRLKVAFWINEIAGGGGGGWGVAQAGLDLALSPEEFTAVAS